MHARRPLLAGSAPTLAYCRAAVREVCDQYGGDAKRVVLAGFSRGAIACNYLGLHDDETAKLWRGFIAYSHYDGVRAWDYPGSDRPTALERLKRLAGRAVFASHEQSIEETRAYVELLASSVRAVDSGQGASRFLPRVRNRRPRRIRRQPCVYDEIFLISARILSGSGSSPLPYRSMNRTLPSVSTMNVARTLAFHSGQ